MTVKEIIRDAIIGGVIVTTGMSFSGCSKQADATPVEPYKISTKSDSEDIIANMSSDLAAIENESHSIEKLVLSAQLINLYNQKDDLSDNEKRAVGEAAYTLLAALRSLDGDMELYIDDYMEKLVAGNEELEDYMLKAVTKDTSKANPDAEPYVHYIVTLGDLDHKEGVQLHVHDGTYMDSLLKLQMSKLSQFTAAASDNLHHDIETNDVANMTEIANAAVDIVNEFMTLDAGINSEDSLTYDVIDNNGIRSASRTMADRAVQRIKKAING